MYLKYSLLKRANFHCVYIYIYVVFPALKNVIFVPDDSGRERAISAVSLYSDFELWSKSYPHPIPSYAQFMHRFSPLFNRVMHRFLSPKTVDIQAFSPLFSADRIRNSGINSSYFHPLFTAYGESIFFA